MWEFFIGIAQTIVQSDLFQILCGLIIIVGICISVFGYAKAKSEGDTSAWVAIPSGMAVAGVGILGVLAAMYIIALIIIIVIIAAAISISNGL